MASTVPAVGPSKVLSWATMAMRSGSSAVGAASWSSKAHSCVWSPPVAGLGSTRVTTSDTGAWAAEMKYYPFGATRYNSGGQKTTLRLRSGQALPLHRPALRPRRRRLI